MRYLIHFSYDGTDFCGFQKQPGLRSVEKEFEIQETKIEWISKYNNGIRPLHSEKPEAFTPNLFKKKVAIITNGGDCPGLNAVIRAIVKTAETHGVECYRIYRRI